MSADDGLRELVRWGVERMRRRRQVVERVSRLAGRSPEVAARGLIVLATTEYDRLRQRLDDRYGFEAAQEGGVYLCGFSSPSRRPAVPTAKAEWLDWTVVLIGYERALVAMHGAATFSREAEGEISTAVYDRARKTPRDRAKEIGVEAARQEREEVTRKLREERPKRVVRAFTDVYERTPVLYNAFAAYEGMDAFVRDYASAMAGAWVRVHLKAFPGSKVGKVLKGEDWEADLVNATALAWAQRNLDAPLKRGTRFRDTLPRQEDGRRQKAPGPPDFVNKVSALLEGRETAPEKPEPPETEPFTLAEQERMRRKVRVAGLTPQEQEVFELLVSSPRISNPEIAARLGIKRNHAGVVRHNVLKRLGA